MFVLDVFMDHIVLAYSSVGNVIVLHVMSSVSLVFPQCVVVSAFSILNVVLALFVVFCMCLLKVSLGSKMSPNIFESVFVGSVVLFICIVSVVLYFAGLGIKSVAVVLFALRVSWLCFVHVCICSG